jgi:hypothetical protein
MFIFCVCEIQVVLIFHQWGEEEREADRIIEELQVRVHCTNQEPEGRVQCANHLS